MLSSLSKRKRERNFCSHPSTKSRKSLPLFLGFIVLLALLLIIGFLTRECIGNFCIAFDYGREILPVGLQGLVSPGERVWETILALAITTQIIMRVSPSAGKRSRFLIVTLLLTLNIRYILWRSFVTLNLNDSLNAIFSISLFVLEIIWMSGYIVQLFMMLRESDRTDEANRASVAVKTGEYQPSVDIFIPTYNEPDFILRRTIVGCQAIDYPNKQVYVLDDGKRSEIQRLARDLGCHYICRENRNHAKAGNLNHAIAQTQGELIACFDADFVPTRNFLTRTVGFFQKANMGLVQTHQCFYNPDLIGRNLGIEESIPHEVEIFSRHYQPMRDGAKSSLCYGSSFVVRRKAIEAVGGFFTGTLSEDYHTGIALSSQGYELIYLDENLSAGLIAEDIKGHISQRQRWARGTLQSLFIIVNPLTVPGLNWRQRISHLEGISQWFNSVTRSLFLFMPFAFYFWGVVPARATLQEWLSFFLPYYLIQLSTFSWLNYRSRSALISDVYLVVQCLSIASTTMQTLFCPFSQGFKVTPKGLLSKKISIHWSVALPFIVLLLGTAACAILNFQHLQTRSNDWFVASLILSLYNLIVLAIALCSCIDVPQSHQAAWFDLHQEIQAKVADTQLTGTTAAISEVGATLNLQQVSLPAGVQQQTPLELEIIGENLRLQGRILQIKSPHQYPQIEVAFESVTPYQQRRLIELLFCRPGQWQRKETPGELKMLGLLLKSLLRPRCLQKNLKMSVMAVNQNLVSL